jgi:hypothetical protein
MLPDDVIMAKVRKDWDVEGLSFLQDTVCSQKNEKSDLIESTQNGRRCRNKLKTKPGSRLEMPASGK